MAGILAGFSVMYYYIKQNDTYKYFVYRPILWPLYWPYATPRVKERREALVESVRFFGAQRKPEREVWVADHFLENLNIAYSTEEVVSSDDDPPDVIFRDARFEIKEIMDPGRRRHAELFTPTLESLPHQGGERATRARGPKIRDVLLDMEKDMR